MPVRSPKPWRGGFTGKLPGIGADSVRGWAMDWDGADEAEKDSGLLSKAAYAAKLLAANKEKTSGFAKLAYALPRVGAVRVDSARNIGSFKGVATNNFLKPPGPAASKKVVNMNRGISSAMNTFKA